MDDFETTSDKNGARVWSWASMNIFDYDDYRVGLDIASYISYTFTKPGVHYFHNLAFDGSYILDYIMKNGWGHVSDKPKSMQFSTLISNMGKFYSITLAGPDGEYVEFRDSLKKIPLSIADIPGAFNLESSKGEIDYTAYRPAGYLPSDNEWDYIRNDVYIGAQAMRVVLNSGMTKLTVGADSLAEYRRIVSGRAFKKLFPIVSRTVDEDIRKAYRGGFTYADRRFARKPVGEGIVLDVNSLYPYIMYDRPLPYGKPWFSDEPESDLFITSISFTAKLKKNHIPCIQLRKGYLFDSVEYLEEVTEPATISLTNVDLALWRDHYDLDVIQYGGYWNFESTQGLFCDYIDKWSSVKANSKGGARTIAKLHLNSLYGKFATNIDVTPKVPVLEDGVVKLRIAEHEERDPVYTAMGVFITSWARDLTIRAAQANYDRFLYADTDSLHLLGTDMPGLDIHPSRLGAWKHEGTFTRGLYLRAKQYVETIDGEDVVHIAGLPREIATRVRFEDCLTTRTWSGKLVPRRVPGGVVLEDTTFTLKNS